jgi:ectoine hydroxylase-related dioxygenase (phytanoyl-CoA dioxygenase family)
MMALRVTNDASAFEVPAALGEDGRLTEQCVRAALAMMDRHGLVVLTGLLSDAEADIGLGLIRDTIEDPTRDKCTFASETDNRYVRRDFCALPSTPPVTRFAATLVQRLEQVFAEFCGRSRPVLEIITLTSYLGSSHQYIHRDPPGVISLIAAVEDVSDQQGGTVFAPGTHKYGGGEKRLGGQAYELMELFRRRCNLIVLGHNLAKLWRMRGSSETPLAPGEFVDRVFSKKWDDHQPNLLRFVLGKNSQFSIRMLGPRTLWKLYRRGKALGDLFHLVQTAPRKGSVILYRSDLLHAGPDNRSPLPRRVFGLSIARDMIDAEHRYDGYSPHPTLIERPLSFGDLLEAQALPVTGGVPEQHREAAAR